MKSGVKIFIDMKIFTETLADKIAQGVNTKVRIFAKAIVASPWNPNAGYALGDLANSIRTESLGTGRYQTVAGGVMQTMASQIASHYGYKRENKMIEYALAQEYGLPGKNYTFRPYMRPAAAKAAQASEIVDVIREATDAATRKAKIG